MPVRHRKNKKLIAHQQEKLFLSLRPALAVAAATVLAAAASPAAHAQVIFTLAQPQPNTVAAGSETIFTGTITNDNSTVIYLNGLQFVQEADTTPSSGVWSTDDSPFFNNVPASLAANGSFTGQIFGLQAAGSYVPGATFDGTVALVGGGSASSDAVLAGPLAFMVAETNGALTPEPQAVSLVLLGLTGIGGFAGVRRRR